MERVANDEESVPEVVSGTGRLPAENFRQAFRELASGVAVITFEVGRELHGFTATSLTSISMEPPLALFCISNRAGSRPHIVPGRRVGMSVLGADQVALARAFASSTPAGGYAGIDVDRTDGVPVIARSAAALSADIVELHPAGESTLCICALRTARAGAAREPLLYHLRDYYRRQPLVGDIF